MKPLPFGSRRVGVLGGLELPAAGCALWSTALHPRALQFWVFLVLFSDVCWLERGKVKQWSCPSFPERGSWCWAEGEGVPLGEKGECPRPAGTSVAEFMKLDVTDIS